MGSRENIVTGARRAINPTTRSTRIKPRQPIPEPIEEVSTKRSIGDVVGRWFREESFYRDVTTRTLSAILAALFAYLGAVAFGYVGKPSPAGVFVLGWALATAILTAYLAHCAANGREWLRFNLFLLYAVASLAAVWYYPMWFGDVGWKDTWSWVALVVQFVLSISAVKYVRYRHRARAAR